MQHYHAAQTSVFAGLAVAGASHIYSAVGSVPGLIAGATDPAGGIETYFPQLGIFAVVVVVFKFMLGRQDQRDAEADKQTKVLMDLLQSSLAQERAAHELTRAKLIEVLEIAHDLPTAASKKITESAGERLTRIQRDIDRSTGYKAQ